MSYIRPLENRSCLYIYPEAGGVRFMTFPEHSDEVIADEMLDVLLSRMSEDEIIKRKQHGHYLLKALDNEDYDVYKKYKTFSGGNYGSN